MKTLVHQKNKILLSLENKNGSSNEDSDFHALKHYYFSMVEQQKITYKNLLKQEAILKTISFGGFSEDLKKWGCGDDPLYGAYDVAVKYMDKLLLDHQNKATEPLSTLETYLLVAKSLKEKIKERDYLLTELDLAHTEHEKLKEKKDTPVAKVTHAKMKEDTKRSAFDECNQRVRGEITATMNGKNVQFDRFVFKVLEAQKALYASMYAQFANSSLHGVRTMGTRNFSASAISNSIASPDFLYGAQRAAALSPPTSQPAYQPTPQPAHQPLPPYQPPQPAYQPPQPAYQPPQPAYQPPQPAYQPPQPAYQPPQPAYQTPQPAYQTPQPAYQTPQPAYQTPQPAYQPPRPAYQPPQPAYHPPQPQPVYQPPQPTHQPHQPTYPLPQPQHPAPAPAPQNGQRTSLTLPQPPAHNLPQPPQSRLSQTIPPGQPAPPAPQNGQRASLTLPQPPTHNLPQPPQSRLSQTIPPGHQFATPAAPPKKPPPTPGSTSAGNLPPPTTIKTPTYLPRSSGGALPPNGDPHHEPAAPRNLPSPPPRASPTFPSGAAAAVHPPSPVEATSPFAMSPPSEAYAPPVPVPDSNPFRARQPSLPPPIAESQDGANPFAYRPQPARTSMPPVEPTPPQPTPAPDITEVPNPFSNRPRNISRPPVPTNNFAPQASAPVLAPAPVPPVPAPIPSPVSSYASSISYTDVNITQHEYALNGKMADLSLDQDNRLEMTKVLFSLCSQGNYSHVIANYFTPELTMNFPEAKLRAFVEGMLKYGSPSHFEVLQPSKPTAFSVAITFNVTPGAKYVAKVDLFFEGEKLAGLFSQKGVETLTIPKPSFFTPPANEDKRIRIWRDIVAICEQGKYEEAISRFFNSAMAQVFPEDKLRTLMEWYFKEYGAPMRIVATNPTRDGHLGIAMIFRDTYLVTLRTVVNLKFDFSNKICSIYLEKLESLYMPQLDRPMIALTIGTKAKVMKGVFRVQLCSTTESLLIFSAPPTIPGHQENGKLNVYSPSPVTVINSNNFSGEAAHWTVIKPSPVPVEVVAEYTWIYKERSLVAAHPNHTQVPPSLTTEEFNLYTASDSDSDYLDSRFQAYLDDNSMRKMSNENDIVFCYRVMKHLASSLTYDASDGHRGLGHKGVAAGCRMTATDCGGHSLLFVSIVRANGIPSRQLVGQWAEPRADPSKYIGSGKGLTAMDAMTQVHVRAEFFIHTVGWVPVEATEKNDPLQRFGSDPGKPFITKGFKGFSFDLPLQRIKSVSASIQTYHAINLQGGKATHNATAWDVDVTAVL